MRSPTLPILNPFLRRRRSSVTFTIVTPGAIVATMERFDDIHSTTCTPGDLSPRYSNVEGYTYDTALGEPRTPPNRERRGLPDVFVFTPEEAGIGPTRFCAFRASDPPSPPTPDLSKLAEALEALEKLTDQTPPFKREAGRSLEEIVIMPKRKPSCDSIDVSSILDDHPRPKSPLKKRGPVTQILQNAFRSIRVGRDLLPLPKRGSKVSARTKPISSPIPGSFVVGPQLAYLDEPATRYSTIQSSKKPSFNWLRTRASNGRLRKLFSPRQTPSTHIIISLPSTPVIDITHPQHSHHAGQIFPSLRSMSLPNLHDEVLQEDRIFEEQPQYISSLSYFSEPHIHSSYSSARPDLSSDSPLSRLKRSSIAARRLPDGITPPFLALNLSNLPQKASFASSPLQETDTHLFFSPSWDSQSTPALTPTSISTTPPHSAATTSNISYELEIATPVCKETSGSSNHAERESREPLGCLLDSIRFSDLSFDVDLF